MSRRIYVATAFPNRAEARGVMQALRDAGHTLSHDWTGERINPEWSAEQQAEYLRACGDADFEGVTSADVFVLLNHIDCRDAMTELGIALGRGIPCFTVYPDRHLSVFLHRTTRVSSVPALLQALR